MVILIISYTKKVNFILLEGPISPKVRSHVNAYLEQEKLILGN